MSSNTRGLLWCGAFLALDAAQAVYFGTTFQRLDSFLVGALVFGPCAALCIAWTWARRPVELVRALENGRDLAGLNIGAAGAWLAYLLALPLIEPAIAFTLFSGAIPLAAVAAGRGGFSGAPRVRNATEGVGLAMLALGMALLAAFTLLGWTGFVRGGTGVALAGLALATAAGGFIAFMLMYGARLDRAGVGPVAQVGLRFPLYTALALGAFALGLDHKGPAATGELTQAVVAGLVLLALPIYAVQKAVSLTSTLTIGTFAAACPLVVLLLQLAEGRVAYAPATLAGLAVYSAGAVLAAVAAGRRADVAGP